VGATKSDLASNQRFRFTTALEDRSHLNMFNCQFLRLERVRNCLAVATAIRRNTQVERGDRVSGTHRRGRGPFHLPRTHLLAVLVTADSLIARAPSLTAYPMLIMHRCTMPKCAATLNPARRRGMRPR
jgi:hypothetical protein